MAALKLRYGVNLVGHQKKALQQAFVTLKTVHERPPLLDAIIEPARQELLLEAWKTARTLPGSELGSKTKAERDPWLANLVETITVASGTELASRNMMQERQLR